MAVLDFSKTNKPNYKERGDYGIRVARPGYDAEICAQNQLIFNSNWPILQITKVMDINLDELTASGKLDHKYYDYTNDEWIDAIPAGATRSGSGVLGSGIKLSKNYVWVSDGGTTYFVASDNHHTYLDIGYKKFYHGLGYVPFFIMGSMVGAKVDYTTYAGTGPVILTSIDIAKDIDYPYTEGALPLLNPIKDYGIKSTSEFGPNVPGLCSNMFSKLAQAVKTTKTSRWEVDTGDGVEKYLCWSPFKSAGEVVSGEVNKYEAYVFNAFGSPFINPGFYSQYHNTKLAEDVFGEGLYYAISVPRMLALTDSPSLYSSAAAYSNFEPVIQNYKDASLVILRSPMVSPEYEEVRI